MEDLLQIYHLPNWGSLNTWQLHKPQIVVILSVNKLRVIPTTCLHIVGTYKCYYQGSKGKQASREFASSPHSPSTKTSLPVSGGRESLSSLHVGISLSSQPCNEGPSEETHCPDSQAGEGFHYSPDWCLDSNGYVFSFGVSPQSLWSLKLKTSSSQFQTKDLKSLFLGLLSWGKWH